MGGGEETGGGHRRSTVSRRQVLRYGLGAGALTTLPGLLAACSDDTSSDGSSTTTTGVEITQPGQPLRQPRVLSSNQQGALDLTLTAMAATVDLGAGNAVKTWTYDAEVPAATWEVWPGEVLRVKLVNELPDDGNRYSEDLGLSEGTHAADLTRPHFWANTNLHTHGLHVSPAGNSDNIFVRVRPGEDFDYEYLLPDDHPAGLFWYHPHVHGAVCQQVRAGMAGMLVVRGDIDEVPEVAAAEEQIMVLQAIELSDDYELMDPIPYPTTQQAFFPRDQILYTVNGRMTPKVQMYPGEVQRWRLLNAAEGKFMSLSLTGHDFEVLAWDGLTLARTDSTDVVMLSAANRVDLLVKAGEPGTYDLMLKPGSSQQPLIPGMPGYDPDAGSDGTPSTTIQPSAELEERSILTLEVTGDGPEMDLPTTLPAYDPPIRPIVRERDFSFTVARGPEEAPPGGEANEFLFFGVDGQHFDPAREPYQARLNTAERWTLTNDLDPKLANHAHSFHIHVNPFKVTAVNGEPLDPPQWRDTMVLPGSDGDSFTMETNFDDFPGKFVEHCHVLSHEDLGMMEAIEVLDEADDADLPQD